MKVYHYNLMIIIKNEFFYEYGKNVILKTTCLALYGTNKLVLLDYEQCSSHKI